MVRKSFFFSRAIRILIILAFVLPVAGIPGNTAGAATVVKYVDADATGANDGTTWGNAYVHLQDALDWVDVTFPASPIPVQIWVSEGVYYPDLGSGHTDNDQSESFTIQHDTVRLYGGFTGVETDLAQRDWINNPTILSGDIDGNDINTDVNFIAEDWNDISGNNAHHVITIESNSIEDITEDVIVDGFVITAGDSSAAVSEGGGIRCVSSAASGDCNPSFNNLILQGNKAYYGGGMVVHAQGGTSSPTLTNISFIGNRASQIGGGLSAYGYTATADTSIRLINVSFIDNYADADGGGLAARISEGTCNSSLTNVEFINNEANANGGGMYINAETGGSQDFNLTNLSFSGNQAEYGGGLYQGKDQTSSHNIAINNSILWGNLASQADNQIHNDNVVPLITSSDIQGCGGSGAWVAACGTDNGGNIDLDPQFENPGAGDLTLQVSSPAIDAGDQTLLPLDVTDLDEDLNTSEVIPLDLALNSRVENSNVDMGAYEHGLIVPDNDNVGFYVPDQLKWYLKNNQTNGWTDFVAFKFGGPSGSLAVSGDWDNDGVDTVGFYVPSQGKWYLKNNQLNGWNDFVAFNFGGPSGSIPVAGDWNNDGWDTVGFYVPAQGKWYLKNNHLSGWTNYVAFNFGGPTGSQPVAGDWDNDGVDTVGFYVPSQGKWYLKNNQTNGWTDFVAINFAGVTGSLAVAGDWDGDGEGTIGFYVPSQLKWYLKNNQVNGWNDYVSFNFGGPSGSQPVAGDWQ